MSRKHVFPIVVMLAAAFVAGLLAVSRTVALGRPASAATASDPAIAFRLKKLDRFEQSLRQQLAHATPKTRDVTTVYRHAPSVSIRAEPRRREDHEKERTVTTDHTPRLYALAGSILGLFLAWAGIAAHPWAQTSSSAPRPQSAALEPYQPTAERGRGSGRPCLARRRRAASSVRVVTLPPLTTTRTS